MVNDEPYKNIVFLRKVYVQNGESAFEGDLFIGRIEYNAERKKWICHFAIPGIFPEGGIVYGDDALESLTRGLEFVKNLILGSIEDGWRIWSVFEGDNAGF